MAARARSAGADRGTIGPSVLLALLGLPITALAGLYWRFWSPDGRRAGLGQEPEETPLAVISTAAES